MTPEDVQALVHAELASLGGHLLSTYGQDPSITTDGGQTVHPATYPLGTLGGFLLEHYGNEHVTYRDPEPPAVGEPPTTTPGSDT